METFYPPLEAGYLLYFPGSGAGVFSADLVPGEVALPQVEGEVGKIGMERRPEIFPFPDGGEAVELPPGPLPTFPQLLGLHELGPKVGRQDLLVGH